MTNQKRLTRITQISQITRTKLWSSSLFVAIWLIRDIRVYDFDI